MPDALELLKTRRSIKPIELAAPGPSAAEIETLLTVASRVPDHGKLVPWRFIIFEGEAQARRRRGHRRGLPRQISGGQAGAGRGRAQPAGARAAGDRGGEPRRPARENSRMGAGALRRRRRHEPGARRPRARLWRNWITEWYAYDRGVLDALGLKENERIAGFVHIGRPVHPPEDRPRPPLAEIATRFTDR